MSKTTVRKGKQDDKFSLAIRELQGWTPENKKCFDCGQRGPTYVNITVGSFVCTKCSGMLRGMNPPHRIKSISMSTFTPEEVEFMRTRGNAWCSATWLARWDAVNQPVDFRDDDKVKDFMIAKYEKRRYYSEAAERAARSSPSISSLSSNSSQDNKPLSTLIGSTIKAHMTHHGGAHIPVPSSVIPRSTVPAAVPRPQDKMLPPARPAQPLPPAFQQPPQTIPSTIQNTQNSSEAFADFANFDTAAFDSLPSDPLSNPSAFPSDTLPPIKKISQGSLGSGIQPLAPGSNSKPSNTQAEAAKLSGPAAAANKQQSDRDRYSALKELDELFKSANIQSPADIPPATQQQQPPQVADSLFGGSEQSKGAGGSLFADLSSAVSDTQHQMGRLSPAMGAWGSAASSSSSGVTAAAAPWATAAGNNAWNISTSPNNSAAGVGSLWASVNGSSSASPAANNTSNWTIAGSNGGLNQQPSSQANSNTLQPTEGGGGDIWAAVGGSSSAAASTNPFGTSPSAGAGNGFGLAGPNFSENNNDLFAAAPKPFNDKSGNPWNNVPVFTQNMTPAPNPHNPFL